MSVHVLVAKTLEGLRYATGTMLQSNYGNYVQNNKHDYFGQYLDHNDESRLLIISGLFIALF